MKCFSEQLKKKANNICLRAAEKRILRDELVSYMEYHPLPVTLKTNNIRTVSTTEPKTYSIVRIPAMLICSTLALAAAFVLIIVPTLAEQTVPGDILYPVKGITEDIRGSLNITPYEKVAWETTRLERRVAEARQLAKEGKLTPRVEAGVVASVQEHKVAAEDQIKTLQVTDSEGAGLAQMTFATALDVQGALLRSDSSSNTSTTSALASALETGRQEAIVQGKTAPVSYDRLMAQLEIETTRAYDLLNSNESVATEKEQTDTTRRLNDLEIKISDAADIHDTHPDAAVVELRHAWTDVQKLIVFMADINVRSSVSIESLVPAILTPDERVNIFDTQLKILQARILQMTNTLVNAASTSTIEKVTGSLPTVHNLITTATSSLANNDLATAESSLKKARHLVSAMSTLLGLNDKTVDEASDTIHKDRGVIDTTNTDIGIDSSTTSTTTQVASSDSVTSIATTSTVVDIDVSTSTVAD